MDTVLIDTTFKHIFECLDLPGFLESDVYNMLTSLSVKVICY